MDSAQFSTDWLQRPPDLELMLEFMPVSREPFQVSPANIWDMDQYEENVKLSGMEGLDDHN